MKQDIQDKLSYIKKYYEGRDTFSFLIKEIHLGHYKDKYFAVFDVYGHENNLEKPRLSSVVLEYMESFNEDSIGVRFFEINGEYTLSRIYHQTEDYGKLRAAPYSRNDNVFNIVEQEEKFEFDLGNSQKLAQKIAQKLGFKSIKYIDSGSCGDAYQIDNNRIMKITSDKSEYADSLKIKGQKNDHLADIYECYKLTGKYDGFYVIIMEQLDRREIELMEDLDVNVDIIWKNYFEEIYGYLSEVEYSIVSGIYSKEEAISIRNQFIRKTRDPKLRTYVRDRFGILIELREKGINSVDFVLSNIGYKPNGRLAFFDLGHGNCDTNHIIPLDIDEQLLRV